MLKKRRGLLIGVLLVATACLVLGVLAMLPPRSGVTKANFDEIKNGMTVTEVEQILGDRASIKNQEGRGRLDTWLNGDGSNASVWFSNGIVVQKAWTESTETLLAKLCRWLHIR